LALALGLPVALGFMGTAHAAGGRAPRVMALDHCSDQYVLALMPRESVVGVSKRADDADSAQRAAARGVPIRRADLEEVLASRAEIVVINWVSDPKLLQRLRERGIEVVVIGEANSFADVRRNIRQVAATLGRSAQGEALVAQMDARLAKSAGAWRGARAIYLTPGGFTAGTGTLMDALLRAAGMTNAETRPGYQSASLERLALDPPKTVVLGFFDTFQLAGDSWGPGRHQVMQRVVREHAVASLPGELLGCPDWTAAEAVERLARSAPGTGALK
jgi:iron complex transport system substrate-binding protein